MKTKFTLLVLGFFFGTAAFSFAGNHPALTTPSGRFATTGGLVDFNPWHKGVAYQGGVVVPGPWYTTCPGMPSMVLNSKTSRIIVLSNGKRMMVACLGCKEDAERNPAKYKAFMF